MSDDLKIIKSLEERLGVRIEEVDDFDRIKEDAGCFFYRDANSNVTELALDELKMIEFPLEILGLKHLQVLSLHDNRIEKLPYEIGSLTNLTALYLAKNQLSALPPEIGDLTNLIELYLWNNQLTVLPSEIGGLTNLNDLLLSENQLTALPSEIGGLTNLNRLYLNENQLTTLPIEISALKSLKDLGFSGNPLVSPPPEIALQGGVAVFEYLCSLESERAEQKISEAKLILIGPGAVGKTCLVERLTRDKFVKKPRTEGIEVRSWQPETTAARKKGLSLNVWDFGGQEIYHATHQFFLTKRSVYLLVWNARKAKDYEHIYQWLHTIEAFGEDSPVILVMAKCDEMDDDLNLGDLREKFPQIIGNYKVDSEDGKGIPALKKAIADTALSLPQMEENWVPSWLRVRRRLEKDKRNWITHEEYQKICRDEELNDQQMGILGRYLHDLGVILHFQDRNHPDLENMVVLKPEWVTTAVYKVLDTKAVRKRGGVLLESDRSKIWKAPDYPKNIHPRLLEIMNKFELAYLLPKDHRHLVAELLPPIEPAFEWDEAENLCFYYRYDFLPAGVMTRFIVRVHQDLEQTPTGDPLCWREGAVLNWEGTRALVRTKPFDRLIEVCIKGHDRRGLLAIIRHEFRAINEKTSRIKIKEEVPCNCSKDCEHAWAYSALLNYERNSIEEAPCPINAKYINVSGLLDGYELKKKISSKDSKGDRIHIDFNPNIRIDTRTTSQATAHAEVNIIFQEVHELRSHFDDLKDELFDHHPQLEKEHPAINRRINEVDSALDGVGPDASKEQLNGLLNKLQMFFKKINDKNSLLYKIIKGIPKGADIVLKLAEKYNALAAILGFKALEQLLL